jgi:UDP-N-acetylglucosamine 2-epimerase (non-hydrolysing)
MIHIVIGTKAQLIKMAPIMVALKKLGIEYNYVSTGQHRETISDILKNFGLEGPQLCLYEGKDIVSVSQMLFWVLRILWRSLTDGRRIFKGDKRGIVLVHGDTFSTILGALMGRINGLKVGHVESGLRSFNLFQPFPEEITRLLTFCVSHVYFCPNEWAKENLKNFSGIKVLTHGNTLYDSLQQVIKVKSDPPNTPSEPFGVVTLHRFENFRTKEAALRVVSSVELLATTQKLLFIMHKPTEYNLKKHRLFERVTSNPKIDVRPRYDYSTFVRILKKCSFVVSDGGSNQEECFYLGKPTLLLREVSERKEGLGENVVISNYDPTTISSFLKDIETFRKAPATLEFSPSQIIAEYCKTSGLA